MMTEKQQKCIKFIEWVLPDIKFEGGTNGHLAYEFIKENLPKAREEKRKQERAADEQILEILSCFPVTAYSFSISDKGITDGVNLRKSMVDGFNSMCPDGIRCSDDIKEYSNSWNMISGFYGEKYD